MTYHETKMCGRKRSYVNSRAAKRAQRHCMAYGHEAIKPYRCAYCGLWHNGHRSVTRDTGSRVPA